MRIGFSSLVCPDWDLATIVTKAAEYQFDGVELRGLKGELYLPGIPDLAGNPGATRRLFESNGVELVCLAGSCTLDARKPKVLARNREELATYIELAASLNCPLVRIFAGEVQRGDVREETLVRIAGELVRIAPFAARKGVTVLLENGGDFCDSAALWYLCDAVSHPAIGICWNACTAMTVGERPTTSIPRLGTKIAMFHVCDADFDGNGYLGTYKLPGDGAVEISHAIDLLKGIVHRGYLMFEWPKLWEPSLAAPDAALGQAQKFLRERVDAKQPILSAYKGDKKAPTFKETSKRQEV